MSRSSFIPLTSKVTLINVCKKREPGSGAPLAIDVDQQTPTFDPLEDESVSEPIQEMGALAKY
ncbi:hypothetical protein PRZ48_006448 [Zasmidium cellare]|uniref:Uncharacterized protein n=1 Tax=Zasmidium cellare TaxID=395010 RepID=A0ABR0EP33_ZASCE|nr:hypothetical protein PRZ48_006448 [Zasmidium cellare]